ncbi:MAG: hypothetical protein Q9166_005521 [cf. Caloplaca sp. 2 TL-2023]
MVDEARHHNTLNTAAKYPGSGDAGTASQAGAPATSAEAPRVVRTTYKGRPVEVTLPYKEHPVPRGDWWQPGDISDYRVSSAPATDPDIPRAYQTVPLEHKGKRQTDIKNPYVKFLPYSAPAATPQSQEQEMAHRTSTMASEEYIKSEKKSSQHKSSPKQLSIMDVEIGMQGWTYARGSSVGKKLEKKAEVTLADTTLTVEDGNEKGKTKEQGPMLDQLVDLGEEASGEVQGMLQQDTLQQLFELEGLAINTANPTVAAPVAPTISTTKVTSANAPSSTSEDTKQQHAQVKRQLATSGSHTIKEVSLWDSCFDDPKPTSSAAMPDKAPVAKTNPSNVPGYTAHNDAITANPDHPINPQSVVTTLAAQELAKETGRPLPLTNPLGTEISAFLASSSSAKPFDSTTAANEVQKENRGGYIRRFQTKKTQEKGTGKESGPVPSIEMATVRTDPFKSLWHGAASNLGGSEADKGKQKEEQKEVKEFLNPKEMLE